MDRGVALKRAAVAGEALFVAAVAAFMTWTRLIPYRKFAGDVTHYVGTDPYYHYRAVLVTSQNFPSLLRWDPWTNYPNGTLTGQFGTLFDLLIAIAVTLTGDAYDTAHVARVVAAAPAVFGGLVAIPVYLLGRRMAGRAAGAWAAAVVALLPGEFYIRSIAGYADHHVAEVLFSTFAVLGVLWALQAGRRWDTGEARWRCLAPSAPAAVSLFVYLWVWPPGVLFVGILGIVVVVQLLVDHHQGKDTRGFAYAAGASFGGAAVLMVPLIEAPTFGFNIFTLIQPLSLAGVALVAVGLDRGAREVRNRGLNPWLVEGAAAAVAVIAVIVVALSLPTLFSTVKFGVSWITGIGDTANLRTIQEVRPSCDPGEAFPFCDTFGRAYGFTLFVALLAIPILVREVVHRKRPADLMLLVWLAVMVLAAHTQVRFTYYLAVPLALANGYVLYWVSRVTGLSAALARLLKSEDDAPRRGRGRRTRAIARPDFRWHQPMAVAAVLAIATPGLVNATDTTVPAWELGTYFSPGSELLYWHDALVWMRDHTPDAGMDLTRAYAEEDFTYPEEAYGVLAWWDYGHWIQTVAERPPVANPFQQSAPYASLFFTDRSEAEAEARIAERVGDDHDIRYVAIGESDAGGKFSAITVWANQQNASRDVFANGDHIAQRTYPLAGADVPLYVLGPEYRESMMSRLYHDDASGLAHYRLVYAHDEYVLTGNLANQDGQVSCFHAAIPGPRCGIRLPLETVQTYRSSPHQALLVAGQPTDGLYLYDWHVVPLISVFEHVPGATLTGIADAGATVTATVDVRVPVAGDASRTFTYTRSTTAAADGTWSLPVSYSTTTPVGIADGGTDTDVVATGPYTVRFDGVAAANVDVPDAAVLDGNVVPVSTA